LLKKGQDGLRLGGSDYYRGERVWVNERVSWIQGIRELEE